MKIVITLSCLILSFYTLVSFAGGKKKENPAERYEFPAAMAQPVRDQYLVVCEKGRILYNISCAKCHTSKVDGKEVIPNFTEEQLGAYSIRVANEKHEMNVSEENVSAEDLSLITAYLTYKKKSM